MAKSNKALFWSLFAGGGMLSAFVTPVLILVIGIAVPLGLLAPEALSYERMFDLVLEGYHRREICRELGIHHSTLYHWLDTIDGMRDWFERMEERAADRRRYRRWFNHPFRGRRPPRAGEAERGEPYPKPFGTDRTKPPLKVPAS